MVSHENPHGFGILWVFMAFGTSKFCRYFIGLCFIVKSYYAHGIYSQVSDPMKY